MDKIERKAPDFVKRRTAPSIRVTPAIAATYQFAEDTIGKFVSWHDVYGAFRQGAKLRVR